MEASLLMWYLKKRLRGHVFDPTNLVLTSAGSTYNRGDLTATNAFFWSSLDLSPYHGTDAGSTPYYIEVLDGAGKKATGYIGAVGAGETAPDELLTNPSFDVDTNGWSSSSCTLAAILGGQNGKCCEVTATGGSSQVFYESSLSLIAGAVYRAIVYAKEGTSGAEDYHIRLTIASFYASTASADWTQYIKYVTLSAADIAADPTFYIFKDSVTLGTMLFDEASLRRVTDPPSTAVHVVSSLNGTTRNWASIESGFNPNDIASWNIYG